MAQQTGVPAGEPRETSTPGSPPQARHGEYKVPGGKLVVVDLDLDPEQKSISRASVNGDFFLEPDDALDTINAALTGLPVATAREDIAQSVRARLPADAQLIGFDEYAIATAFRRALGLATTWQDHQWEVLPARRLPIALNVALDQVLTEEVAAGNRAPVLRLWDWSERAVVIGSFQSLRNEVDAEAAAELETTVVRRITGGGAMFMEPGNCITYSLCFPQSLVDGLSFADSYPYLDSWVMEGLAEVGVSAHYKPLNDIVSDAGKIGGAAQKRLASGGMLHHVTMSYDIDAQRMMDVLRIGREKISDKGITSAVKRVDPLRSQTGMARGEIMDVLRRRFEQNYGATVATLRDSEIARAEDLVASKFGTREWTARVP